MRYHSERNFRATGTTWVFDLGAYALAGFDFKRSLYGRDAFGSWFSIL